MSVGLLTQLMNPDPAIFPENHPYRRGYSSSEIPRVGALGPRPMFAPLTSIHPVEPADGMQRRPQISPLQFTQQQQAQPVRQRDPQGHLRQQEAQRQLEEAQAQEAPQPVPEPELPEAQPQAQPQPPPQAPSQQPGQSRQHTRQTSHSSTKSQGGQSSQLQSGQATPSAAPRRFGLGGRGLQMSKSNAAVPVASQVQVGSAKPGDALAVQRGSRSKVGSASGTGSSSQRSRGPPQGQEMETDTEDDGEGDNLFPNSVAREKLKLFADRRGIQQSRGQSSAGGALLDQVDEDSIPPWAREAQPQHRQRSAEEQQHLQQRQREFDMRLQAVQPPSSTPIPLMHPYNLPPHAAPTTPRTTRVLMLKQEMSESFRRHLLWERRQAAPIRRTASSTATSSAGGVDNGGNGGAGGASKRLNALSDLKPLTSTPSMVQLHARGSGAVAQGDARGSGDRDRRASGDGAVAGRGEQLPPEAIEEQRRRALARNRSWANNYHTSGW
ncbi:hypothetical protein FA15DRAFT_665904 [Coprinopsis marcescibilis]|uniref:DUF3295 domain-containing protein n=1 Tax=Coprinopsis marcescibilis TaxID=230819 RepID=A0A5C3L522_COPMA|nr:hypothetical protein FA15DRAFT_665904 [Coprinopsis marcescibilis]